MMDSTLNSSLKTPNSNKKQIKLPFNENNLFVPEDQLTKIPKREDDKYLAGDLVWVKTKGFSWWPCMITVDPQTGKYSKSVVIRNKNEKVFHVQYFGSRPYRGYTEGNIMKYDGKEKYELKLDQIKNTPTPNKSQRKQDLLNYDIKQSSKKEWSFACDEADEAMKLDRVKRIEQLTFQYIVDKPKSLIKQEEKKATPAKSSTATPSSKTSTSKKRKIDNQIATLSTGKKTQSTKRKKKAEKNSSPGDIYDFNEFSDEYEETPKKPFELSSAKRAKGEYEIYVKKEREHIEKENPELDANEIEQKLKKNWNIMSEDMRNNYSPKPVYSNLSFQLESPTNNMNTSKTVLDTSASKQIKTYSGLKRGRKPLSANKKENDFEKENTVDKEESSDEESTPKINKKETNNRRSSSRKKLFNQGNEEANDDKLTTTTKQSENLSSTPNKRRSARMSAGSKMIKEAITPVSIKKSAPVVSTKKQPKNSAKKDTNNQLEVATNNISDESSSENEKIDLKETDDKNKEKCCGKCHEVGKNLIKCDGDCLTYYHKECLHKESSS